VGAWIVPAARIHPAFFSVSAPDDHLTASPYRTVIRSGFRRPGDACGCPTIRARIVPAAATFENGGAETTSAPDDHFTACPDCSLRIRGKGRVRGMGWGPTIRRGSVFDKSVE